MLIAEKILHENRHDLKGVGIAMTSMPRLLSSVVLVLLLLSAGCTQPPDVPFTIPGNGASNVEVTTDIQVAFTTAMDPSSSTDPANWTIQGSLSGPHPAAGSLNEDSRILTLIPETPFQEGETVTVVITEGVRTNVQIPIDPITIQFTTVGAGAGTAGSRPGEDQFSLVQITPNAGDLSVSRSPSVTATFDLPYQVATAAGAVSLRGSRTGLRTPQLIYPAVNAGVSDLLQVLLEGGEAPFYPGEEIELVFDSKLLSQLQTGETEPRQLVPFVSRYRAALGFATGGLGPREPVIATGTNGLLFADLGEMLPYSGLELVTLSQQGQVSLLRAGSAGDGSSWSLESQIELTSAPAAAVLADLDGDSRSELIVSCEDGFLHIVTVIGQELVEEDTTHDMGGLIFNALNVGELSGDQSLEIVGAAQDGLRIIQNTVVIDPGTFEVSSALSVTGILPMPAPVESVVLADFDKDGRLDLLVSAGVGLLLRGAGNATFLETAFLEPAPFGKIVAGDVNGDGWLDAITPGTSGLSIHLNPAGQPPLEWTGVPLLTGGPVIDVAVTEVDGDPVEIDDIVIIQDAADELILLRRLSPDLGDSEVVILPFFGDAAESRLSLVDTDGDLGTDILVRQLSNSAPPLAVWRSIGVIDDQQSALEFQVPASIDLPPGTLSIEIPITATFEDDLSGFRLAMDYDESLLIASELIADPATFPFGSVEVVSSIDAANGLIAANMQINGYIPAGTEVPIARVLMQPVPSQLGEAQFLLADGLSIQGTTWSNQGTVDATGALLAGDVSSAQGVVFINSATPAPEALQCEITSSAGQTEVILNWSNPVNYDLQAGIEIRRGGALLSTISGTSTSFIDTTPGQGSFEYSVIGFQGGVPSAPTSCTAVIIPTTNLNCERNASNPANVELNWLSLPGTSAWQIFRDGGFVVELPAQQLQFIDAADLQSHIYEVRAVQGGATSAGATCIVEDAGGTGTANPTNVQATLIGLNDLLLTWNNQEFYDELRIFESGTLIATLGGQETEYEVLDLLPGSVAYSVQALGDGGLGAQISANQVSIPLASPTALNCSTTGPAIELTWENGPDTFDYDEIVVERTGSQGTDFFSLPGTTTTFSDSASAGSWTYRVIGYFFLDGINNSAPSTDCQVTISERIYYDPSDVVVGRNFEVEILGQILEDASGWSYQIDYDGNVLENIQVSVPGVANNDLIVTDNPLGTFAGLRRLTVEVANGSAPLGGASLLGTISGSIESNFDLLGPVLFHLVGGTLETASGVTTPALQDGGVTVVGNALFLDPGVLIPGEEVVIWARGVWSQSLTGYSVILDYDPAILTCLEVSNVGTVGEDLSGSFGLFFSGIDPLSGKAYGSVISTFDTIPANPEAELGYFRFMVSPDANEGDVTAVNFGIYDADGVELENVFVDSIASTIEPVLFSAEFQVLSQPQPPVLLSVSPETGPAVGGTEVMLNGTGFTSSATVFFGANSASEIVFIDSGTLLVNAPAGTGGLVDVTVLTEYGQTTLAQAFTYYNSTIESYSPEEGSICSPTTMLVTGAGIPEGLQVFFGDLESVNVQVLPDGTMATVRVPASPITGEVDLRFLDAAGTELAVFPGGFTYFDDGIFLRGDVTCDGLVNIADVAMIAAYVAGSGQAPVLLDSADIDDNGVVHIGDAVQLATWLFDGGAPPAPPFPSPGPDPTPDGL
ncbi:MAG: hypothetical protein CBC13_08530 [Planctomycetia bacterium TMED53]|nr:MAG: hypothetical protein CBC13_08530 [Planctomycetia bacterium TMED53]